MTSSILLATDANNPQVVGTYNWESSMEEKGKQLPRPSGYRILCAIPEAEKEFEDSEVGLIKADETMRNEETLTTVLFVVDMGPDCYQDPSKFPTGPWCKPGILSSFAHIQVLAWSYMAVSSASSMTILSRPS
jgi:hypothetical protein